jgi:uncharacterized membrane protein
MPIEFNCTQCSQLLRVPDNSAGKSARCPKCQALMVVPAPSGETSAPAGFSQPLPAKPFAGPPATGNPFSSSPEAVNPFAGSPPPVKPPENPFADKSPPNPYASPTGGYEHAPFAPDDLPITNVAVSFDAVWNHALRVWQANIGMLVVITLIMVACWIGVVAPFAVAQEAVKDSDVGAVLELLANIVMNLTQLYLGIGEAVICLKLARGMPASIGELFTGGVRFFPVLGFSMLAGLAILACLVPGIIFLLYFWPCYYLLIERRATFFESFSVAARITEGNRATTFLIWLVSVGVGLLGYCALCFGLLFALPLISVMWATAYLMMSGQLAPQPMYARF